ncbi:MAG: T9SS type A sorting domain-containing protein [Ignavibacteriae bacterium]|nr:T9SS type A sorting domain-containing protein [Ignavibacteriota bacterium]MCB0725179.1 T9SS type A sorting domain-containing protein [Ignavibacteriota bacterium]MCB9242497.1 T9SS type A sorting domain-containing protein [Ignavibacteriales bacterium]
MIQKIKYLSLILFLSFVFSESYSQSFDCYYVDSSETTDNMPTFLGRVKPNRTTLSGDTLSPPLAHFPVIIVFVQFQDDAGYWDWPDKNTNNGKPIYLDSLIAAPNQYNSQTDWWDAYNQNTQQFSDYYMEASRGNLHVLGKAYSVVLSGNRSTYTNEYNMNQEILDSLTAQGVDWVNYDRWSYNTTDQKFYYTKDKRIDMIFRVVKSRAPSMPNYAGYNAFGGSYSSEHMIIQNNDTVYVNSGSGYLGSGITGSTYAQKYGYLALFRHELGHQMFSGGHSTYSAVSYGFGFDGFFSPNDMITNQYMEDTTFNFSNTSFELGDYSSRNSNLTGNVLTIPIQGDEIFSIAYRNKESYWDRPMSGDVALIGNIYNVSYELGRGLYIYHFREGYHLPVYLNDSFSDMECADGYWNWEFGGYDYQTVPSTCYQSPNPDWPYWNKTSARYDNDSSTLHKQILIGDGISFHYNTGGQTYPKWWGNGEKQSSVCEVGTDRIETNLDEIYTRGELAGDRDDPWLPGYNEVFSPYSSPSSSQWNQSKSNIFIWFHEENHGNAELNIYKVGQAGLDEDDILELTPPSRPMGLKNETCEFVNNYFRPKISWQHNMEPDMIRTGVSENYFKRYKIYRSVADSMDLVPPDAHSYSENVYTYIATVDIDTGTTPTFVDTSVISGCYLPDGECPPYCWIEYPIRYRVQAVDVYDDASVLSDFVKTTGIRTQPSGPGGGEEDERPVNGNGLDIPTTFALKQNFPNPFNPSTNIQFDLPKDVYVSIKVYDILGREVATIVNELRKAGSYIISFNGSKLSSGIYYYKIKAGNFVETKKMLLIK